MLRNFSKMSKSSKFKITYNNEQSSLLSWTSDMQCWSFSLPAGKNGACPLAVYEKDSVCMACYAMINRYNMPNVLVAQYRRYYWLKECFARGEAGIDEVVNTLTTAIKASVTNGYFRWYDSGDFFDYHLIRVVYKVCQALPDIKFWIPTRVYSRKGLQLNHKWEYWLGQLNSLPNVIMRPSAIYFNELPPVIQGYAKGTTVISDNRRLKGVSICPKTLRGGDCESNHCRSCWENEKQIAYLSHGVQGSRNLANALSENIVKFRKQVALTIKGTVYAT